MSSDQYLDKMVCNLSNNVKTEVAKYINIVNKKNENILNQLPLVISLREQLAKYKNNNYEDLKILQEKVAILEKKQRTQGYLCKARSLKLNIDPNCSQTNWAPKCMDRKYYTKKKPTKRYFPTEHWASYEEAKTFASKMNIKDKKIWLQWSKMNPLPRNIPPFPQKEYLDKGWNNWWDFLGLENNRVSLTVTEMNDENSSKKDIKKVIIATTEQNTLGGFGPDIRQNDIIKTNRSELLDETNGVYCGADDGDEDNEDDDDDEDNDMMMMMMMMKMMKMKMMMKMMKMAAMPMILYI